jgi:hypothetical protein
MNEPVRSDYDVPIGGYQHPEPPQEPIQEPPPLPRQEVGGFGGQTIRALERGHKVGDQYKRRKQREKLFKSLLAMERKGVRIFTQDAVKSFGKGIVEYFPPQEFYYDKNGRFKTYDWYKHASAGVMKYMQEQAARMEAEARRSKTKSQFEAAKGAKSRGEAYEGAIPAGGYGEIEGPVADYIGQKPSEQTMYEERGRQKREAMGGSSKPRSFESDAGRVDALYRRAVDDVRTVEEEISEYKQNVLDIESELARTKQALKGESAAIMPEEAEALQKKAESLEKRLRQARSDRDKAKSRLDDLEEKRFKAELIRDMYRRHGGKISYPEAARKVDEELKLGDKAGNPLELPRK